MHLLNSNLKIKKLCRPKPLFCLKSTILIKIIIEFILKYDIYWKKQRIIIKYINIQHLASYIISGAARGGGLYPFPPFLNEKINKTIFFIARNAIIFEKKGEVAQFFFSRPSATSPGCATLHNKQLLITCVAYGYNKHKHTE